MGGKPEVIAEGKTETKEKIIPNYEKRGKTEAPERVVIPQPPNKEKK